MDDDEVGQLSNDLESPQLNLVRDAFSVLCSKELKVGSRTRGDDEDLPAEVLESKKTVLSKVGLSTVGICLSSEELHCPSLSGSRD